jgi:hypothetical protein
MRLWFFIASTLIGLAAGAQKSARHTPQRFGQRRIEWNAAKHRFATTMGGLDAISFDVERSEAMDGVSCCQAADRSSNRQPPLSSRH